MQQKIFSQISNDKARLKCLTQKFEHMIRINNALYFEMFEGNI